MHRLPSTCLLSLVLLAAPLPAASSGALADMKAMAIDALLNANLNQRVTLLMQSGRDITGLVDNVGADSVHIRSVQGKEFYDAVVHIDDIEAVMARVRNR